MNFLDNIDLFSVGLAVAAIGILGFVVYISNRKSITNKTFLIFSVVTILWGIVNYSHYQTSDSSLALWLLRIVIFLGVLQAFTLFQLFYVFPEGKAYFSKFYKAVLIPVVVITSLLNLTPLVLSRVSEVSEAGRILKIENGPGIFLFGIVAVGLVIGALYLLFKKLIQSKGEEKSQFKYILIGTLIMFVLIITFNFIFPAFLSNTDFIRLGAVFILPFVGFAAYAILRHHLLGVKVIATEILTFFLAIVVFYEVIFAPDLTIRIFRIGTFLLVLAFGILLIKSVRREVEQRERLQQLSIDLRTANEKLKQADKVKSEFLGFASHQVKSPMNVVKGFAQLIADGTYGPVSEKVKETAGKIKSSADRLISLVNDLLDIRKIEEGKLEFNFKKIDIVKFVMGMVDEYRIMASKKGLEMKFSSDQQSININADEEKIRQVIQNVIDNSIKYTDQGHVNVNVKDDGDKVLIEVEDTGKGMSKELQQKLFQRFIRDEKTKTEVEGTGLGLFIAKQIVEAHRGTISAESEGEGKGSRFKIRLGHQ